mmetsp:Transcript_11344/g.23928  ORF Transcript_11344/g.23928 Transcript_11344/m.23928 type:complete len:493 (-) Transcript_11344:54-1532(-)|eukprot:CAMPEP_0171374940 /NCGR_PEP_ID=MMETSP0879-20121228/15801_1 /TAXON_ID=67004 /ORGANISM="Thalassiosira weissflogii, Strain CCMP1336" /LENGTH=492 /DNA_ID=CAMNT_0011884409 /DNA_START=40 /DNA_END=1518 /DNA_ORIENTATION=-
MGSCQSSLYQDCLSSTDVRYDSSIPSSLLLQDPRWEALTGYFRVDYHNYDPLNGGAERPIPYFYRGSPVVDGPYDRSKMVAFYNHTVTENGEGSRLIMNRYYFRPPAPLDFCSMPSLPPLESYECGVTGYSGFAAIYSALNHENDGTLSIARATGFYAPGVSSDADEGSLVTLVDDNSFEIAFRIDGVYSTVQSLVFFDNQTATISAVTTNIPRKAITAASTGKILRLTEQQFLQQIQETNNAYNVPDELRITSPMTSDDVPGLEGTFPSEDEWCGGLIDDTSCTISPYQEPEAKMKVGYIAVFVIVGLVVFGVIALWIHRKMLKRQEKRYKEHFVRGIAKHINVTPTSGQIMSAEMLKKEFDLIDKDGGGTISKEELKKFLNSGKVGSMDDKDFEAMWTVLDVHNTGEIDFVEFTVFLSSCGEEFDAISKEQKQMTKEEKFDYASRRISSVHEKMKLVDIEDPDFNDTGGDGEGKKEGKVEEEKLCDDAAQ